MTEVLVADCVAKTFAGRPVLTAGTLRAMSGEVRGLLGRNGAGKSTLIKIAAGWIAPDSGIVRFDGVALGRARLSHMAVGGLFYLPDHDLLSEAYTIRHQLELFQQRWSGGDPEQAATTMGVAHVLDQRPHQLSGGELRRAELAAALVRRPRCLLADEPYRGVAPYDAESLSVAFKLLAAEGCAVVVTGHEVDTLFAVVSAVTWCTSGTTYELGPPALAATHEGFRREYLGPRKMPPNTLERPTL